MRDYTIHERIGMNGVGVRIRRSETCQVIRERNGAWIEIGPVYELPVDETLLIWTRSGIPASVLAVALRVFELDNPGSRLRTLLTAKNARQRDSIPAAERDRKVAGAVTPRSCPNIQTFVVR